MITIYYGEDKYLTFKKCENTLKEKYGDFSNVDFTKYNFEDSNFDSILENCSSFSFFSDTKVVIIDDCLFLNGDNKKEAQSLKLIKKLIDFKENFDDASLDLNLIVYPSLNKSDEGKKLVSKVNLIKVELLNDDDCKTFVLQSLNKNSNIKKKIDNDALNELISRCKIDDKMDFLLLKNSLDKLMTYTDYIRLQDVEDLITKPFMDKMFSLTEYLLNRKTKEALHLIKDLFFLGYTIYVIIPYLVNSFSYMAKVKYLAEYEYMNDYDISVYLKEKSTYKVKINLRNCRYLSYNKLIKIVSALHDLEYNCKINANDPAASLETFILHFTENYL